MKKEALISCLREDAYVSGEALASRFGVSRAAVAKAVAALRRDGYDIDAVNRRGYRLRSVPDLLSAERISVLLGDHPCAPHVQVLGCVDSTNTLCKRLAAENAPDGTVVLAEEQTAGRGRLGRSFVSPKGAGVYLSMLLRPHCPPGALMTLTAQAAVALSDAILSCCGAEPEIKWVNDLLLHGKKICGILTELSVEAESGLVSYAVIGAGVNCSQSPEDFPPALRDIASSLYAQTGVRVDRNVLAAEMIRALSQLPSLDWRQKYRSRCVTLGKRIVIHGEHLQNALALDVGENAELLVRYPDGTQGFVNAGEVSIRPAEGDL